jgi:hypothetical protein
MPRMPRVMNLGGQARVTEYATWYQGVAAQTPQMAADTGAIIPARAPRGLGALLAFNLADATPSYAKRLGKPGRYPRTQPLIRMGPVPKLSTGSGQTAARPGRGLGFTPGGYTPPQQIKQAGMDMMPYLHQSFDASPPRPGAPGGFPRKGVAANSGWEMQATYHPHDWVIADRFNKMGRMPGPWQQTSFPDYRALQVVRRPRGYNLYNNVALARPLSPSAYFLGYQTASDVAARIGGGVNRPLGY